MTLNAGNDLLLCKVFPASLRGLALAWFHKLPQSSINTFNKLWGAFISQHLCSMCQKMNISSLQTILKHEEESIRDIIRRFEQVVQQIELQHGFSPSELQEKLWVVDSLLPLTISRPDNNNGRVIQAGKHKLNVGGQYLSSNPDSHDHKLAD